MDVEEEFEPAPKEILTGSIVLTCLLLLFLCPAAVLAHPAAGCPSIICKTFSCSSVALHSSLSLSYSSSFSVSLHSGQAPAILTVSPGVSVAPDNTVAPGATTA